MHYTSIASFAIPAAGTTTIDIGRLPDGAKHISLQANFTYGSGGTTFKAYLQTSFDGGSTWTDIASLAHATTSLRRAVGLDLEVAAVVTTATDATLTDNTKVDGLCGQLLRIKHVTVGTYADSTCKFDLYYR